MEPLIRLRGAAFGYGAVPVVSGLDLEFGPGTFVGILGPNGSGKSTLLRGVLGLLAPLAGSVERTGVRFAYVPQRDALDAIFPFTVAELVATGAWSRLSRWRRPGRAARGDVRAALARVGLEGREAETFSALSGGQRQRSLIARALLARPNFLVLDEPTGGVDRAAEEQILSLLHSLHRDDRIGIALVSHHLGFLRRAVREVLWVDGGRARPVPTARLSEADVVAELFGAVASAVPTGGEGARP